MALANSPQAPRPTRREAVVGHCGQSLGFNTPEIDRWCRSMSLLDFAIPLNGKLSLMSQTCSQYGASTAENLSIKAN